MNCRAFPHARARILLALCFAFIPLGLMLFFPEPPRAHAVGIVVNNLGEGDEVPGDLVCETAPGNSVCTLRAAIELANSSPGTDSITFSVTGTIVLTNTLPSITDGLTINGPGAGFLAISGANSYRVLQVNGVNLTLSGVTIANGNWGGGGGGIFNFGTLNISGTTFYNNSAPGFSGGAIYSVAGTMNITNSTFYSNTATGNGGGIYSSGTIVNLTSSSAYRNTASFAGGAIYQSGGALFITNSAIYTNTTSSNGGAIYLDGSLLELTNSAVYSNTASDNGGAIYNINGALLITNDNIYGNRAIGGGFLTGLGGGIYNYGAMNVTNSILSNNSAGLAGGGITMVTSTVGITGSTFYSNTSSHSAGGIGIFFAGNSVNVTNTTLYSNTAASGEGGGIYNESTLTMTGGTLYSNAATNGGGGIYNTGALTMTNSTLASNRALSGSGGGIENPAVICINFGCPRVITITNSTITGNSANSGGGIDNSVSVILTNTIVANNVGSTGANCNGTITDGGKNLQWNPSSGCGFALAAGDPKLGPLGNYGGSTKTLPLFVGSVAIDAGNDSACPLTDQRGVTRPQGPKCDIGAFEGTEYPLYLPLILK